MWHLKKLRAELNPIDRKHPVLTRTLTGIAVLLAFVGVMLLWSRFPIVFNVALLLAVVGVAAYILGSIVWEIINS